MCSIWLFTRELTFLLSFQKSDQPIVLLLSLTGSEEQGSNKQLKTRCHPSNFQWDLAFQLCRGKLVPYFSLNELQVSHSLKNLHLFLHCSARYELLIYHTLAIRPLAEDWGKLVIITYLPQDRLPCLHNWSFIRF